VARVATLTETNLRYLWQQVKEQDSDDFWGDLQVEARRIVKHLLEASLEQEMITRLGAVWYQRHPDRRGRRNGYYERDVLCDLGLIENLRVPRSREPVEDSEILERYRRRQGQVNRLVREMFLSGVSTRQVGEVLEPLLGGSLSASTVSAITRALDREVAAFLSRPLGEECAYLLLDGLVLKVKSAAGVKKKLILCAYGITEEGRREIISFRLASAESEAQWEAFLSDLWRRGLEGKKLRLITTDGCTGLGKALETVYPFVPRQLCWAHKMRNVAAKLPRKLQKNCLGEARTIYQANTKREATSRAKEWARRWRDQAPGAVASLERDLEELLSFLSCPKGDWRRIRTTNAIERAFREVRRRIRPMSCFNNPDSCRRIIYGIASHLNKRWKDRSYSTHLS
jgi:putative transposase